MRNRKAKCGKRKGEMEETNDKNALTIRRTQYENMDMFINKRIKKDFLQSIRGIFTMNLARIQLMSKMSTFSRKVIVIGKGDFENVESVGVDVAKKVRTCVTDSFLKGADLRAIRDRDVKDAIAAMAED
jgi:hypothetical protein